MSELNIFASGVFVGGLVVAFAWALLHILGVRGDLKAEIKIDEKVLRNITDQMVTDWLNARGLVWMQKGLEYLAKKENP